jgi:hypothetical protein
MKFPSDMAEKIRTLIRTDKLVDGKLEIFFDGVPGPGRFRRADGGRGVVTGFCGGCREAEDERKGQVRRQGLYRDLGRASMLY